MSSTEYRPAGVDAGVGRVALMAAAARAIETYRVDCLARDIHAEHFVRAAHASAAWPVRPGQVRGGEANPLWGRLGRYVGLRTRVLDDAVLRAARTGVRQTVLLGAGLDSRAFRLDWPDGSVVFEVDRGDVLAFKNRVLRERRAVPGVPRIPLPVDPAADWARQLLRSGFDPALATAWVAEDVLPYLPHGAARRLVDTVDRLSGPGSVAVFEVRVDVLTPATCDDPIHAAAKQQIGVDLRGLLTPEPRPGTAADLAGRGWSVTIHTPFEFSRRFGRGPLPAPNDALVPYRWGFAHGPHT